MNRLIPTVQWRQLNRVAFKGEYKLFFWCRSLAKPTTGASQSGQIYQVQRKFTSQSKQGPEVISVSGISSGTMSQYVVGHDLQKHYFYIQLRSEDNCGQKQGDLALLDYKWVRPDLVDLYHTEVPPEFQGHGIAKHLAKAAFEYFCEKEIKFRPTCTYLQKYLKENPTPRYTYYVDGNSA